MRFRGPMEDVGGEEQQNVGSVERKQRVCWGLYPGADK